MRVVALTKGFFDVRKNGHPLEFEAGDEFEVPDGVKSRWFRPVEKKPQQQPNAQTNTPKP